MRPSFYKPQPALADYVSHIMIQEAKPNFGYQAYSPFPPTPQHMINFYPRDVIKTFLGNGQIVDSPQSIIVGPQVSKVDITMGSNHLIISVGFQPGGLHRLLKIPLYEMLDQAYDAELVLGKDIKEVNERLKEAATHQQMKLIVETYLLKKIVTNALMPWERVMKLQLLCKGSMAIGDAASLACLSSRQYERKSNELMGYSPKLFSKLIRFSAAYRLKESNLDQSWTSIAHASGYYDQMHLIRDFKEFTGSTPGHISRQIDAAPMLLQHTLII